MPGIEPFPDSFPDEVPGADAVEQVLPVIDSDAASAVGDDDAPLETDPADWQEQRLIVEDPDEEFR